MTPRPKARVLLVDDRQENLLAMKAVLEGVADELVLASSGVEALRHLLDHDFAAVLLDVVMPGMDGFETATLIHQRERSRHTPIIFLTAIGTTRDEVARGYQAGCVDYLLKPFVPGILRSKVEVFVELFRLRADLQDRLEREAELNAALAQKNETLMRSEAEQRRLGAALQARNDELQAMSRQLWHAAKLAAVGELAASLAHEINNPLATVSLRVEMLLAKEPAGTPTSHALRVVAQEVERMSRLVMSLLQFSRQAPPELTEVELRGEVAATLELVQHHLRKVGIHVTQEIEPGLPPLRADRQKLRQVFLNLLTNAADATPRDGRITVRIRGRADGSAHIVEIEDTGCGIPPEALPRVTEAFFTTKPEGKGTGLGLSICRRILREHGGTLEITSEVGRGTRVTLILPVVAQPAADESTTTTAEGAVAP